MNSSSGSNQTRQKCNQNIQVYVRVRPLNARERGIRSHEVVDVAPPKEIIVRHMLDSKMTKKFTFDRTFGPESNQTEVYQYVVAPLIEEVLAGYNCTVFAYGQTGTGKTHTMIGTECPELKSSWDDESMIGIIPRALSHLFDELRMMEMEFSMRISYLELYNEELCDLLSSDDSVKIRIFDDSNKKGSVIIQGLEEIPVHSKNDVYKLLEKGKERRKTATTLMNAQSSRSHTVFSILVHIKENGIDGEEMLKIGKLNLVDLAGSENISKAGNEKGIRSRETVNINQSLLTLGRVITALVERTPHIPYRESKLTRLLQESLGGRTKTSIIATISPGHKDLEETLSTLEYAHRAKNIQNKPELNQKLTKKTVIKEYTEEIDRLKRDLMAARDKNGIYLAEETYNDMQYKLESQNKELTEKMLLVKALKDDLASKEKIFNEVSLHLVEKSEELKKKDKFLHETQTELDQTKKVLHTTKRRYKEKKILLDSHVKTEQELTSQATKLIEVADVATADSLHLHSSIERRKDVETKNQTAFQQLTGKMCQAFDMMNRDLEGFRNEHDSHSEIMKEQIESNMKMQKEFSTKAIDKIKSISNIHNVSVEELSECFEKYSTQMDGAYVFHKTAFNSMIEELRKKQEDVKLSVEKQLSQIKSILEEQSSSLENNYSKIMEISAANSSSNSEYLKQIQDRLAIITRDINAQLQEKQTNLDSCIEERQSISEERKQILSELTQFHTYFMQKMEQLQNKDATGTESLKKISEFKTVCEPFTNSMNNEIKSVEKFVDKLHNESKAQNDILTALREENSTLANNCLLELNNIHTSISDYEKEHNSKTEGLLKSVENYGENLQAIGGKCKEDVKSQKEKSIDEMDVETQQTIGLVREECTRINGLDIQNRALITSLQNYVKDYSANNKRHMNECHQHMDNFQKSELKTYSPTGQTPSKKEFSYPRILAATSPHNLIIKRFRYENDWSDLDTTATITEDSSETTINDISDNCIVVNSTPIKSNKMDVIKHLQPQNSLRIISQNLKTEDTSSRKNSPVLYFNKENKENCT